jgi:hypothetical protein
MYKNEARQIQSVSLIVDGKVLQLTGTAVMEVLRLQDVTEIPRQYGPSQAAKYAQQSHGSKLLAPKII